MRTVPNSARRWPGSVVSSTCSFGLPAALPKISDSTSGPRLDPPMPSSTASLYDFAFSVSALSCSGSTCWPRAAASQPSHLPSSPPVHSVASPCQKRRVHASARAVSSRASTAFSSPSGRLADMPFWRSPRNASRLAATAPSSASAASENCFTPSGTSAAVTSLSFSPSRSASASTCRASSTPSFSVRCAVPWSRNASIVLGGMVFTVSGPISVSI